MAMDIESSIQTASADRLNNSYSVGLLKKSQDQQKLVGQMAVKLIDNVAAPQMTKTADGHISVRA